MANAEGPREPQPPLARPPDAGQLDQAARQTAQQAFGLHHQFGLQIGPAPDALIAKLDPPHITSLLENAERENNRNDSRKKQFFWGTIGIGTAGFLFLCWLFLYFQKPELLQAVLTLFGGFLAGFAGGYGFGRSAKK